MLDDRIEVIVWGKIKLLMKICQGFVKTVKNFLENQKIRPHHVVITSNKQTFGKNTQAGLVLIGLF